MSTCPECGKEFAKSRSSQVVCSKECKRKRDTRKRIKWAKDFTCRSSSRICPVCRKPIPEDAPPNQRTHKGECTEIWQQYQCAGDDTDRTSASVCALSDEEYATLGVSPPKPGIVRCLGPVYPEHQFWSPDTRVERVCPKCKEARRAG